MNSSASSSGGGGSAGKPEPLTLKDRLTRLDNAKRAILREKLQKMRETLRVLRDRRYKGLVEYYLRLPTARAHPSAAPAPPTTRAEAERLANKAIKDGFITEGRGKFDMGDEVGSMVSGASGSTAAGGLNPDALLNGILRIDPMNVLVEKLISGAEVGYPDVQCIYKKKGPTAHYFKSLLKRLGNQDVREGLEAIVRFISKAKTGKDYTFDLSTVMPASLRKSR